MRAILIALGVMTLGINCMCPDPLSASAAGPSPRASRRTPRTAVILETAEGRRALADYRETLENLCRTLKSDPGGASAKLGSVGLAGADEVSLCANAGTIGEALASGSFEQVGADEVVLSVPSGMDRASGDHALALMRLEGKRYQLVGYPSIGNDRFEARLRLTRSGSTDLLMICHYAGQMGVYQGTCGLYGRGSFKREPTGTTSSDEIQLIQVSSCGPGASVSLGKMKMLERRLRVELVVERFVLEPKGPAEREGGICSQKVLKRRHRFGVDYELEGGNLRRVTPLPVEVTEIQKQY